MSSQNQRHKRIITFLSVIIPIAVASLFKVKIKGVDFSFLPPIYAGINAVTFILLIMAVFAIKRKNRVLHEKLMKLCVGLSTLFLLLYIAYHITSETTVYGGDGALKYIYYFVLITHIILSIVVIPFVLLTFSKALMSEFDAHKKIARITYPLWLYVTFTGVVVYLLISPYYA